MTPYPARIEDFRQKISWHEIEDSYELTLNLIQSCLKEDLNPQVDQLAWQNDLTTSVCGLVSRGSAHLVARESFVLCGIMLPDLLFNGFSCDDVIFLPNTSDGQLCEKGDLIGTLEGAIPQILAIERTLLNLMQRLSGVATKTAQFVKILDIYGVGLLDTRKTTPGLRIFEKFATACGGSFNHRMGLFDRILIKDNHLAAAGIRNNHLLGPFLKEVKKRSNGKLIELEIDELAQLEIALECQVDAILLDNFTPEEVNQAVQLSQNRVVLEASGGINETNLSNYAAARPHFISTGSPVHAARWVDIGLDWIN